MGNRVFFWGATVSCLAAVAGTVLILTKGSSIDINSESTSVETASQSGKKIKPHSWRSFSRHSHDDARRSVGEELRFEAKLEQNLDSLLSLLSSGREGQFLDHLNQIIKDNPQVPEFWALKADYFHSLKQWSEAEEALEQVVRLDPQNLLARATLGEVNAIRGKLDEGLGRMKEVLAVDPHQLEALYGMVSISQMQGRPGVGEQFVLDLYERDPRSANVAMVVSDIYASRRDWDSRTGVLLQAVESDPQNPGPYRLLSVESFRRGNYLEALRWGEKSLARDQNDESRKSTLDVLAQSALLAKDLRAAEKYLELKRQVDPFDLSLKQQERELVELKQQ